MQKRLDLLGSGYGVDMDNNRNPICYLLGREATERRNYDIECLNVIRMLVQVQYCHLYCQILAAK